MLYKNKYLPFMKKNPVLETYFPDDLEMSIDLWPRNKIEQYHRDAIAYLINHAYKNNQYCRSKYETNNVTPGDFRSLEDLEKFPFTYKSELMGDPWRFLSVPRQDVCQIHMSTGTTSKGLGDHIYRLLSWEDIYVSEIITGFPVMLPNRRGDVVVIALPYEMSSAGMAFHKTFQFSTKTIPVNVGKGGHYSHPLKTLHTMIDLDVNILLTTPSYAMLLYETAKEGGMELSQCIHPKYIWLTGEGCSDAFRDRISRLWGCECLKYYGSLECGPLGLECIFKNGFHIPEGHVYIEIINPETGRVLPDGMIGEVCVTVLNKIGAPLLRYRTEDLGYIDRDDCPCCIERPRIFLRGRNENQIVLDTGIFSPFYLEQVLYGIPEIGNSYQFIIKDKKLSIKVELPKNSSDKISVSEKIKGRMECYVGHIEYVELVEKIPFSGGKATRVIYM